MSMTSAVDGTGVSARVGTAMLLGSVRNPSVLLSFPPRARHPVTGQLLMEWVRALPGARFDPSTAGWVAAGIGDNPDRILTDAGFAVGGLGVGEFVDVSSLDQLTWPVSLLADDGRTVLVRHRLGGFDACRGRIGPAAVWDKGRALFKMPLSDLLVAGVPRAGVVWDPRAIDRAYSLVGTSPSVPGIERDAARLATAPNRTTVEDEVRRVAAVVGHYPSWWRKPPMPHQVTGALAVAAGHTVLADDPGVGKTVTALLAATISGAKRVMVTCPPKVATHWGREVIATGMAEHSEVVVVQAGRKTPPLTDETKVVVVPYSMLTERPAVGAQITLWQPDWIIADEAHLMKTETSKRTEALLRLRSDLPDARCVALTGTPVLSGPHELVPLLEFAGHLTSQFGGASAFLERYCRQDKYGAWHPNKRTLRQLHRQLTDHVWVRRTKAQVLENLPPASVERFDLPVDLADYNRVHQDVLDRIDRWLDKVLEQTGAMPQSDDIDEFVDTAIEYASWLRRAAGRAKVPAVRQMIAEHVARHGDADGQCANPLLVWAHHSDVVEALCEASGAPALTGSTSKRAADRLIDGYQAGQIPVLVCSIQAVGAGITLTRGHDAIFAEVDWTPAIMQQALDRQRRIGQLHQVRARIPVALGTLDEHMAKVLGEKAATVGAILGDASAEMFSDGDGRDRPKSTPAVIVKTMIRERIAARTVRLSLAATT